jgi:hypothetical protein
LLKGNLNVYVCLAIDKVEVAAKMLEERLNGKPGDVEGNRKFTLM